MRGLALLLSLLGGPPAEAPAPAKNVIVFIGDGMGEAQLSAARRHVRGGRLSFDGFPVRRSLVTDAAGGALTDSAAGATAIATGVRVHPGVVSVRLPGDGRPLPTALELQAGRGRWVGLVTVETPLVDATPAAFGAHAARRDDYRAIARGLLTGTRPHVLFGPPGPGLTGEAAAAAGYRVLATLPRPGEGGATHLAYLGAASLADLVAAAYAHLARNTGGFFLLAEHEGPDTSGHHNDLEGVIRSVLELDLAVGRALALIEGRRDTLVVVTADHETGGLALDGAGDRFSTTGHTRTPVPLFATGPGSERLATARELADLFPVLAGAP